MFYLTEFFKSLGESLIRGFFFFFFSCLLAFSLTHRSWIAKTIEQVTPEKMVNPYFVAVVDGTIPSDKVKAIVAKLPGVLSVDDRETGRSKSKLAALMNDLGSNYTIDAEFLNFKSLRVVLNPSLSEESLEFIRGQVVKMGGKEHVTATAVKYPEVANVMKAHPFYSYLTRLGDWGVVAILGLFWIVSYWLCYDVFRSRSYIIEKFQRKKLVAAKSIATGLGLVMVLFSALGIWNGTLRVLDLVILFMVYSVFWTFSMQDWKWKPTV